MNNQMLVESNEVANKLIEENRFLIQMTEELIEKYEKLSSRFAELSLNKE